MAYDEETAARVRGVLSKRRMDFVEKKMFGGLCFMVEGYMCVGFAKEQLMVRVGADGYLDALDQQGARPMTFTGKPLAGFVYVDAEGYATDAQLAAWVKRGTDFVRTLPRRVATPAKTRPAATKRPAAKKIRARR